MPCFSSFPLILVNYGGSHRGNLTIQIYSTGNGLEVSGDVTTENVRLNMSSDVRFVGNEIRVSRGSLGVVVRQQMHPVLSVALQGKWGIFCLCSIPYSRTCTSSQEYINCKSVQLFAAVSVPG